MTEDRSLLGGWRKRSPLINHEELRPILASDRIILTHSIIGQNPASKLALNCFVSIEMICGVWCK